MRALLLFCLARALGVPVVNVIARERLHGTQLICYDTCEKRTAHAQTKWQTIEQNLLSKELLNDHYVAVF